MWRARWSIPSLLATYDERSVVSAVAAINGGLAILVIGLAAWVTDLPLIFPALGPTAFILYVKPFSVDAAPRSVVLGHFAGIVCGLVVHGAVSLACGSPVSLEHTGAASLCAAALALALTCLMLVRLRCPHAPACATALIIAMGAVADWRGALAMALAVVMITLQAVCVARITGVNVPTWHPRTE